MTGFSLKQNNKYQQYVLKKKLVFIILVILTIIIALYATGVGTIHISAIEILKAIFGNSGSKLQIIMGIRLPRVITALIVGATLAASGAVMQCVLQNPLASSSTLGVSQGAAFGAALGIIAFTGGNINSPSAASVITINNPYIVTLSAFIGGSISTAVVIAISQLKKDIGATGLILAGVALSSLFAGGTTLLQYFADETKIGTIIFWTFGNLGRTDWNEIILLFIIFCISIIYFLYNRWNYNAMQSGADTAKSLGVNTRIVMLVSMTICSLSTAVAVSFVGIISFVGLIAPHIMRLFLGEDYRFLIPCSAITGALLLMLADTFARSIISPIILPIGAITSFLGAQMFLFLLFRGVKTNG